MLENTIVLDSPNLLVELISNCSSHPKPVLVFTFTNLEGAGKRSAGFAETFLINAGYSVLAFKGSRNANNWFQDLREEDFVDIESTIQSKGFGPYKKIAYGSSMGGYAGIAFSKRFDIDGVLALSPQFDIRQEWDQRWSKYASQIDFKHLINEYSISKRCVYCVVCDPYDKDYLHYKHIESLIPSSNLISVLIPFSGHPSGHYLKELDLLKGMVISFIENLDVSFTFNKTASKKSSVWLSTLAEYCMHKNKLMYAKFVYEKLVSLNLNESSNAIGLSGLSKVSELVGNYQMALFYSDHAVRYAPHDKRIVLRNIDLHIAHSSLDIALDRIETVKSKGFFNPGLINRHFKVLDRMGKHEEAVYTLTKYGIQNLSPSLARNAIRVLFRLDKLTELNNFVDSYGLNNLDEAGLKYYKSIMNRFN